VELRAELAPLKEKRLKLQAEVNRLTFEQALDGDGKNAVKLAEANELLSNIQSLISPLQSELDRLTRQFWVTKEQVRKGGAPLRPNYDFSASRYRQVEADSAYHEKPAVTLERVMLEEMEALRELPSRRF
jgi:hypothetical protein